LARRQGDLVVEDAEVVVAHEPHRHLPHPGDDPERATLPDDVAAGQSGSPARQVVGVGREGMDGLQRGRDDAADVAALHGAEPSRRLRYSVRKVYTPPFNRADDEAELRAFVA